MNPFRHKPGARWLTRFAAVGVVMASSSVHADPGACVAIQSDAERLACYDRSAGRAQRPLAGTPNSIPSAAPIIVAPITPVEIAAPAAPPPAPAPEQRTSPFAAFADARDTGLAELWELEPRYRRGVFGLRRHRPLYALVTATSDINALPTSPSQDNQAVSPLDLMRAELKLQLSFKTKAWEGILGSPADLWLAYTQVSYWQAFNGSASSPFRVTDYEPEAIVVMPLALRLGPVALRMAGLGLVHQSNGQALPYSRSWNRVDGRLGIEAGGWSVTLRPWWRIRERADEDDNPDIQDFIGRGELVASRRFGTQRMTLTARHSLRSGDRSRGSLRIDWSRPLVGALNAHVQLFHGWGANLLDYNFKQTMLGVGLSLAD